jgi:4-hydroxybenzoyl-CoA reductase subunit beta
MKHGIETPTVVVNIKRISGLDAIRKDNGAINIGSLTSLKVICETAVIQEKAPALVMAASSVGSYHHQTMGTLGGNICQQNRCKFFNQSRWWRSSKKPCIKVGGEICHVVNKKGICYSSYCGDVAPVLLVLKAIGRLESDEGVRDTPAESLFSGDGKAPLLLNPGEVLTEIVIPEEAMSGFSVYTKFANRESIDFPIVGVALWACVEEKKYRVAFTAVDRKPIRARSVEGFLNGKDLSNDRVEEVTRLASKEATPVKTSSYSPAYKRMMMGFLLNSAMNEVMRRVDR